MSSQPFDQEQEELFSTLIELTKNTQFLKANDIQFIKSNQKVASVLEGCNGQTLGLINQLLELTHSQEEGKPIQYQGVVGLMENFRPVLDIVDNLLEKVDVHLEAAAGVTHAPAPAVVVAHSNEDIVQSKNVLRPQLKFRQKPDNSNTPFVPIIKVKPNAKKPLVFDMDELTPEMAAHVNSLGAEPQSIAHPYQYEIQHIEYPPTLLEFREEILFKGLEQDSLIWIDTVSELQGLCRILNQCTEFAVDLEHHDYRSFLGFTCLMQISTRDQDYAIDTLLLRDDLHVLNEAFTNPNIVKVFHGADMDIQWLQRDFGVYVVSLFDTYHASHLLDLAGHGYAYLLQYYCQVETDKKYQLADWRIRPIPSEMLMYAQNDTHYLLYIYDRMRNELIKNSNPSTLNLIHACLERSALTSLKKYDKEIYNMETGEGTNGWANTLKKCREPMNEESFAVYKAIHGWRDHIARQEDESIRYVLPNHMLFTLARVMPKNAQDLIGCCNPTPALVRLHATDLASLIERTVSDCRRHSQLKAEEYAQVKAKINEMKKAKPVHIRFDEPAKSLQEIPSHQIKHKIIVTLTSKSAMFGKAQDALLVIDEAKLQSIKSNLQLKAPEFLLPAAQDSSEDALESMETDAIEMDSSNEAIPETTLSHDIPETLINNESIQETRINDESIQETRINNESIQGTLLNKKATHETSPQKRALDEESSELPSPMAKPKKSKKKKGKASVNMEEFKPFDYSQAKLDDKTPIKEKPFQPHGVPVETIKNVNLFKLEVFIIKNQEASRKQDAELQIKKT